MREMLLKFFLRGGNRFQVAVKDDGPARCRALINGKDMVFGHGSLHLPETEYAGTDCNQKWPP